MMINNQPIRGTLGACVFASMALWGGQALAAELIMVEEDGCYWCEAWNKDVSAIYPKTVEGKAAPLKRMDIDDDLDALVALKRSVHFTPTFLLVENGQEVSRIEGYPGEDFFWGLLGKMLGDLPSEIDAVTTVSSN